MKSTAHETSKKKYYSRTDREKIVDILIRYGAEIDIKDDNGRNSFYIATEKGTVSFSFSFFFLLYYFTKL